MTLNGYKFEFLEIFVVELLTHSLGGGNVARNHCVSYRLFCCHCFLCIPSFIPGFTARSIDTAVPAATTFECSEWQKIILIHQPRTTACVSLTLSDLTTDKHAVVILCWWMSDYYHIPSRTRNSDRSLLVFLCCLFHYDSHCCNDNVICSRH